MRSVILTSWRSGSTFLGDVVNAHPANFYHYEPLLDFGIVQIRGPPLADEALRNLESLLRCDFNTLGKLIPCTSYCLQCKRFMKLIELIDFLRSILRLR